MRFVWANRVDPSVLKSRASSYLTALGNYTQALENLRTNPVGSKKWTYALNYAGAGWRDTLTLGKHLVPMIMGTVAIPPNKAKKFEMAARLITTARSTRDPVKWAKRNLKHLELIAEAVTDWDLIGEDGGDQMFPVADFDVINTIGLVGKDLDPIKLSIARAYHWLRKSGVPKIQNILKGEVHLVGRDASHSLMHELGHRYWNKFASRDAQRAWRDHHYAVDRQDVIVDPEAVDFPEVGETIEIAKAKGRGKKRAKPKVLRITGESPNRMFWTSEDRYFPEKTFLLAAKREAQWDRFPTAYSSQDPQEHFCEALALHARGDLDSPHKEAFEEIWT
jgi:hypothetical protein